MEKKDWLLIITICLSITLMNGVLGSYYYTPMNFEPGNPTNHTFTASMTGYINVTLPPGFTLLSGNNTGSDNISFVMTGPNTSDNPELFTGIIYLNNVSQGNYYLISIEDNKIVDTKVEIGHGDFNYINYDSNIGAEPTMLFNLIRVWPIGNDILKEPATNISFSCDYPLIIPRTVDSKYTTTYNYDNITAEGLLEEMEGLSMFRIFVLAQEINKTIGENYTVACTDLNYKFTNTEIIASIQGINLEARNTEPLIITTTDTDQYVAYIIKNNESYELRNLEFTWKKNNYVLRSEKNNLLPGETVVYHVYGTGNGNIDFKALFNPEWMFNSRAPTLYSQTSIDAYNLDGTTDALQSVEETILDSIGDVNVIVSNNSNNLAELLFLFKVNTNDYELNIFEAPTTPSTPENFTAYKIYIKSNGIHYRPIVKLTVPTNNIDFVNLQDSERNTLIFDLNTDQDGISYVEFESELPPCTEDNVDSQYNCPLTTYYVFLHDSIIQEGIPPLVEFPLQTNQATDNTILGYWQRLGAIISPSMPQIGMLILLLLLMGLIFGLYYYKDELSLRQWINQRKEDKARKRYIEHREENNPWRLR